MKVAVKNTNKIFDEKTLGVVNEFLKFLQSEAPLSEDIKVILLPHREGLMTTGSRLPNQITVLAGNRLLIDVLRTISHEWIHEFQTQKLGVPNNKKIRDIGGPIENMANAIAGIHIKKFVKLNPDFENLMYGETE